MVGIKSKGNIIKWRETRSFAKRNEWTAFPNVPAHATTPWHAY